jgi:hydrogenase maturation protease
MTMKTLILGMGNPILSDDGVGLQIARALEGKSPDARVTTSQMVGLNLLDHLRGYEKLFLIDALVSGENDPGELKKVPSGVGTRHLFTSHGLDFFDLLELGKNLGFQMPEVAAIYGIEIENPVSFGEELSPLLLEKLPGLIQAIAEDIRSSLNGLPFLT